MKTVCAPSSRVVDDWQNRAHFFAVAAQAMRRILVDYAVTRKARKRGGGWHAVELDQVALVSDDRLDEVLSVDAALTRLARIDARAVCIIECRVFMGMTIEETAAVLHLSSASVKRHWTAARAWLTRELTADASEHAPEHAAEAPDATIAGDGRKRPRPALKPASEGAP